MLMAGHLSDLDWFNVDTERVELSKDKCDKCTSSRQPHTHTCAHTQLTESPSHGDFHCYSCINLFARGRREAGL